MVRDEQFRACDADRERVAAILRDAYTAGRLSFGEFDERITAAFAARTWGDLRALTRDLPVAADLGPLPVSPPLRPKIARPPQPAGLGMPVLPIALVWLVASVSLHAPGALIPVVFFAMLGLWWATRLRGEHRCDGAPPNPCQRGRSQQGPSDRDQESLWRPGGPG